MSENGQNAPHANECRERPSASYEATLKDNCKGDAGLSNGLSTSFIRYDSTRSLVARSWLRNFIFSRQFMDMTQLKMVVRIQKW